jgi:hypothetical protein
MFVLPICGTRPSIRGKSTYEPKLVKIRSPKKKKFGDQDGMDHVVQTRRICMHVYVGCGKGVRGWKDRVPFGQVFHTSSFTRPTVVSGSNAIDLRRPETSRNCTSVCGTCGTTAPVSSSSSCPSSCAGGPRASTPSPPSMPLPSSGPGTASSEGWLL